MMANANEESSRARNLNDNSTSEVGYVLKQNDIRFLISTETNVITVNSEERRSATASKVTCFKCREDIAPYCPLLRKGKNNSSTPKGSNDYNNVRRVDFCVTETSMGRLTHLGESFPFYFDFFESFFESFPFYFEFCRLYKT